jgi:hypothetical protein
MQCERGGNVLNLPQGKEASISATFCEMKVKRPQNGNKSFFVSNIEILVSGS